MNSTGHVLIVEDEAPVARMVERILTRAGYSCEVASTASEARLMAVGTPFELALCDLLLPDGSGLDLGAEILALGHDTAVVIATGVDDPEVAMSALDRGVFGFIVKPFRRTELLIAAANALKRRSLEREARRRHEALESAVRERTAGLQAALNDVQRSRCETIARLAQAVEARDAETGGHMERMSLHAERTARALGLPRETCELIRLATPLHDIGKIGVPDAILLKPGALTADERRQIERHAEIGHQMLAGSSSPLLELAASIAWTHHERHDGGGYPRGLRDDEIPIEGRIAAVADVFDALTSDRPYRPAYSHEVALRMMRDGRGTHFDPRVLDAFLGTLESESLCVRSGARAA